MRIRLTEKSLSPLQRLQVFMIKKMSGMVHLPSPILLMSYRRELFGKYYVACTQEALREAKFWTVAEVEIMAAFVSNQNECQFCVGAHSGTATLAGNDRALVESVLADWKIAPISEKLRAALGFLEKLGQHPEQITSADIEPMRKTGLTDAAIEEVIKVAFGFHVINRLADALEFRIGSPEEVMSGAKALIERGYLSSSLRG